MRILTLTVFLSARLRRASRSILAPASGCAARNVSNSALSKTSATTRVTATTETSRTRSPRRSATSPTNSRAPTRRATRGGTPGRSRTTSAAPSRRKSASFGASPFRSIASPGAKTRRARRGVSREGGLDAPATPKASAASGAVVGRSTASARSLALGASIARRFAHRVIGDAPSRVSHGCASKSDARRRRAGSRSRHPERSALRAARRRGRREEDAAANASESSSDRSESESESERDALGFAKSASSGLFLERPLSGDRLEEPRASERSELSSELSEERSAAATSVSFGSKDARFAGYDSSKGFGSATRSAAATVSTSATAFGASNGGLAKSA